MKKIFIASDHRGFEMKNHLIETLKSEELEIYDHGPWDDNSCDYPDYAHLVSGMVSSDGIGILICGSANGVSMTANKWSNIRAAVCWNTETSSLSRMHNDANVLCIPAQFVSLSQSEQIAKTFISTEFEGGRHETRVKKINP